MEEEQQAIDNMKLFVNVLEKTMKTFNIVLGWDIKNKQLVLKDMKTGTMGRVELGELNKVLKL